MEERTFRPSMKTVWAGYVFACVAWIVADWAILTYTDARPWVLTLPLVLFVFPLQTHLERRVVSLRLQDDHLTFESGFLSRTRRTLDMAKIQDVTVRQTLGQRLLNVGDIMLESAGETGGIGMRNFDGPRALADEILSGSRRALGARVRGGF